jgi:hypothetical protein
VEKVDSQGVLQLIRSWGPQDPALGRIGTTSDGSVSGLHYCRKLRDAIG